eukprot:scaffold162335_cov31-Tisochrysis_lutea.AAC.1
MAVLLGEMESIHWKEGVRRRVRVRHAAPKPRYGKEKTKRETRRAAEGEREKAKRGCERTSDHKVAEVQAAPLSLSLPLSFLHPPCPPPDLTIAPTCRPSKIPPSARRACPVARFGAALEAPCPEETHPLARLSPLSLCHLFLDAVARQSAENAAVAVTCDDPKYP